MDENPFPAPSLDNKTASKKRKRFVFLFFAIVFILLLIYVGSKVLGTNTTNENAEITPTPTEEFIIPTDTPAPTITEEVTPSPTSKPTPSPTPKTSVNSVDKVTGLDRKDLKVIVQNGSGESGVAGKVADILKGLGYNVVSTGNADNFNYSDVTIQVKSAQSDFLPIIKKDLSSEYTIGSSTSDLPSSSSSDAVVIVGK
ncbi:MAG: LytR C-terminal domain-containing protein [Patescibacteria group bacterium]